MVKTTGVALICCRSFHMASVDSDDEGRWKEHFSADLVKQSAALFPSPATVWMPLRVPVGAEREREP